MGQLGKMEQLNKTEVQRENWNTSSSELVVYLSLGSCFPSRGNWRWRGGGGRGGGRGGSARLLCASPHLEKGGENV